MFSVINILLIILTLLFWLLIIIKFIANRSVPVKKVKAEVIEKYNYDKISKYQGIFKNKCYTIVFEAENEKILFDVSEFSYNNYKINEKGTLTYKGNKIISFK